MARQWITEIQAQAQFKNIDLTPKLVTSFIRVQELNFEKAFQRSQESNLPPPTAHPSINLDFDLHFHGSSRSLAMAKLEIQKTCHHYHKLYTILAPQYLLTDERPRQPTFGDIGNGRHHSPFISLEHLSLSVGENIPDGDVSETPPTRFISEHTTCGLSTIPITKSSGRLSVYDMSTASPESSSIFDLSSQASSRSTLSAIEEVQFTFETTFPGFPPRPVPKILCIPRTESNKPAASPDCCNGLPTSTTHSESVNRAPIPVLKSTAIDVELSAERMETNSLTMQLSELNLETRPTPSSASITRKRKRTAHGAPFNLATAYDHVRGSRRRAKRETRDQRILELESAIIEAKEKVQSQLAKPTPPDQLTCMFIQSANNLRREAEPNHNSTHFSELDYPDTISKLSTTLARRLEALSESILSTFEAYDSPVTNVRQRQKLLENMDEFCNCFENTKDKSKLMKVQTSAAKVAVLSRIRHGLLTQYPSSKSRPNSQKRHTLRQNKATEILKAWLRANEFSPYPTKFQREELSKQTGLTLRAIGYWFGNVRWRGTSGRKAANMPRSERIKATKCSN